MGDYKKLKAYIKAFDLAMEIFQASKSFPSEERFSLTDQIRRSSRSVCTNFGEAYRRRRYKDYFISKLNDAQTENTETNIWLDFALACKYISNPDYTNLCMKNEEVGKLLSFMINYPQKFM